MTIEDLLRCANLLVFEDKTYEDYPYFAGGTGFIIRFEGALWLITAKHCLENQKVNPEQISILPDMESQSFIPYDLMYSGNRDGLEDWDYTDFVILRIKQDMIPVEERKRIAFFDFNKGSVVVPGTVGISTYISRGYPKDLNHVDYDRKKIPRTSFSFELTYDQPDRVKHCHLLRYPAHPKVTSPDGLSGSPIFAMLPQSRKRFRAKLSGMIIRGGNGIIRCIEADILMFAMNHIQR